MTEWQALEREVDGVTLVEVPFPIFLKNPSTYYTSCETGFSIPLYPCYCFWGKREKIE